MSQDSSNHTPQTNGYQQDGAFEDHYDYYADEYGSE